EGISFQSEEALHRYVELANQLYNWTSQDEFDGRSPEEVLASPPRAAAWPPESEWPPADRPLWSRARILAALDDPRPFIRRWAVQRLEYDDDPEVERRLEAVLADPDPDVRFRACLWATRWGSAAMAGPVLAALEREASVETYRLGSLAVRWAPEKAVPLLAEKLQHEPDPGEMRRLCLLLGEAGTPGAIDILRDAARSRPPLQRFAAAAGLLRVPDDGIPLGIETLAGLCAGKRSDRRRVWDDLDKWEGSPWSGLEGALELIPAYWASDRLEAFSPRPLADLLGVHAVSDPRRFVALLRTDAYGRIRRAWNKRQLASDAIVDLAGGIEAALAASEGRDTVGFRILAARLSAFASALRAHASQLAAVPSDAVRTLVEYAIAALAKACHGRLLSAELEARRGSSEDLLDLNDVDLPFLAEDLPTALARFGEEAAEQVIARLGRWGHDFGTVRSVQTIARLARDPMFDRERASAAIAPLLASEWDSIESALERAVPRLGDPILPRMPIGIESHESHESDDEAGFSEWRFADVACESGTERALFFVRHFLPRLRAVVEPYDLADCLVLLAHPSVVPVLEEMAASGTGGRAAREALEIVRALLDDV
ncbi:MAG: HEAT repeat domain-containing protein, partial [Planctomycetes bacterium]|nr:HEAT repeat domain-containing protein [Planctomycetota bacterium]